MHIANLLIDSARESPEQIGLQFNDETWTYEELYIESLNVASYLQRWNIEKKHVGIYFNNEPEFIFTFFGVLMSGNVAVPIPFSSKKKEIDHLIKSCDVEIVICHHLDLHLFENSTVVDYRAIQVSDDGNAYGRIVPNLNADARDLAILLTTSGSTREPKVVMLSHENIVFNAIAHAKPLHLNERDSFFISMPCHFSSTITTQLLACIYSKTRIYLRPLPLLPKVVASILAKENITSLAAVPTFLNMFMAYLSDHPRAFPDLKLIVASGAPLYQHQINKLIDYFPYAQVIQTYGLTEASPRVSMMKRGETKTSCGKTVAGVKLKIVDEERKEVGRNEIGEIVIQGNNVMLGYYKNELLTQSTMIDGWLYTGDLGYVDDDGDLHVAGRKKNIIIVGGVNVIPEEIEETLLLADEVSEVVVVKKQCHTYGEIPVAVVKPAENKTLTVARLKRVCLQSLSPYKIPKEWYTTSVIPRTKTGKYNRGEIEANIDRYTKLQA